jgi:RND family efflux transporter MFP subunit
MPHGPVHHDCRSNTARAANGSARALALLLLIALGACGGAPAARSSSDTAEPVARGDTGLRQTVVLSAEAVATSGVLVAPARADAAGASADDRALQVPGQVDFDPRRVAVASSRIPGRIEHVHVVEGDELRDAQAVASLYSAEFLAAQSDLQQAERRVRLLQSSQDSSGARALADAAARRLVLMGATDAEVTALRAGSPMLATLTIRSPLGGSVMQAHVLAGTAVDAGAPIATVADLTVVDVVAEIPEVSLPIVRVGQSAAISIGAYPKLRFAGTVERLRNALNPETRTVRAVIHVPNSNRALRPGMYATVRLDVARTPGPRTASFAVLVPETAIVSDGGARIVFVEVAPRTYERRVVQVESLAPAGAMYTAGRDVRVVACQRVGERIVVQGAFMLKSELGKAALGEEK